MAIATGTLLAIAGGVSAASSIAGGLSANRQANFQAAATLQQSERQAKIQEQKAARERQIAAANEADFRKDTSRTAARRRAALGASGVETGTGSPILASQNFATEAELQALRIRHGGETTATRIEQQAELDRLAGRTSASLTTAAGKSAKLKGFARAGSSLLTGFSKF